ncbi:MAG: RcnB family protein [Alphaproteobacteria bacterium]
MNLRRIFALALAAALLAAGPALADKGGVKPGKMNDGPPGLGNKPGNPGNPGNPGSPGGVTIGVGDRSAIQGYYSQQAARGNCPPGLAKKNNGCLPPGQAKKYAVNQALPASVVFQALPPDLAVRLSPPAGYRYVYLDGDVLLMAIATRLIVDAFTVSIRF